jgi:Tfp pilus assembly protein PilN
MRAVNLIPAEQRGGGAVGAGRSRGGAHAVLALLGGLALMALLYGVAHHQVASRRAQAAAVTAEAQGAQAAASRLAPYTSFIALREARVQAVSQLVNSRFDWAHAFHEFGRVLPADISIGSLSGSIGPAGPAGSSAASAASAASSAGGVASVTPPGSVPTFTLAGCATSQPAVAQMLGRLRLIDGVKEVTLQSSTKGSPSGGGAGCGAHGVAFAAQVSFDPLPSVAAASAAAKTVVASSTTTPTSTGAVSK